MAEDSAWTIKVSSSLPSQSAACRNLIAEQKALFTIPNTFDIRSSVEGFSTDEDRGRSSSAIPEVWPSVGTVHVFFTVLATQSSASGRAREYSVTGCRSDSNFTCRSAHFASARFARKLASNSFFKLFLRRANVLAFSRLTRFSRILIRPLRRRRVSSSAVLHSAGTTRAKGSSYIGVCVLMSIFAGCSRRRRAPR